MKKITKHVKTDKNKSHNFMLHPSCPFHSWELIDHVEKDLANKKIKKFIIDGFSYPAKNPVLILVALNEMTDDSDMEFGWYAAEYSRDGKTVRFSKIQYLPEDACSC